MKNSKEYSSKVHKLYRSLKRRYPKVQRAEYDEPVDALVYAIISENMSEASTQSVIKRFTDYFVDWNDLRVSRQEEIIEMLGSDTPAARDIASSLNKVLWSVFGKYNMVSLEAMHKMSKRPAKQALEKMEGTSRFVVDYCMLTSLHGHAIPLTKNMIEYLRSSELVHPEADEGEISGFLARQISAENAYEFYYLLRLQGESHKPEIEKKTTRRKRKK
jgi:endonuclease III